MTLARRVNVDVFKRLRGFCDQWIASDKMVMKRAGFVGVLVLTQGRGQVVKGDLPRLSEQLVSLLPTSLSALEDKSEDEKMLVGDEGCSATDSFTLYSLSLSSLNPYVDWCVALILLNELYGRFTQPMHAAVRERKDLLDRCSLLLVAKHCYVRLVAVTFFKSFFENEFGCSSACDASSWLQQPGAVFYVLQRALIAFHLPHTDELVTQQSELLTCVLCGFGEEGVWPRPTYLNNKELRVLCGFGEEEKGEERSEDVRQFYDMSLIEESESEEKEEKEVESEEKEEEKEVESEEEEEVKSEEEEDEKEESEKKKERLFKTLHRVPNPHRFEDCLFLVGSTLTMNEPIIKKSMIRVIEMITAVMTPQAIEKHIVGIERAIEGVDAAAATAAEGGERRQRRRPGVDRAGDGGDAWEFRGATGRERVHSCVRRVAGRGECCECV